MESAGRRRTATAIPRQHQLRSSSFLAKNFCDYRLAQDGWNCRFNENLVFTWGRNPRCHPEPAAFGGRIRMTLTAFGTLRLHFFPQPIR